MSLSAPMRCSTLANELGEPMIGSVDQRDRWLLVEDDSAWGADAVKDVLGAGLAAGAKARAIRLLLIRRRSGAPSADTDRRAILVDTATREMAARSLVDVAELSLDAVASAPVADFGPPHAGPIFLVCTNGRRDACCALRGRALVTELVVAQPGRTWECTHLGGHRFSANLVCLPDGIVYGRVAPSDGPRLAEEYIAGRLDPLLLRGRSAWPAPAQVAEQELRIRFELSGLGDVRLEAAEIEADRAMVTLVTTDGLSHRLELHAERATPPRSISCRADELEQPIRWRLVPTAS